MPAEPPPPAPRRLPLLLRRAWFGLNQKFRQRVSQLSLTPDQFSILRWLAEGDPAGLTQRQLTDLMTSDPNTITSTLTRMERAGLVTRQPHERDRRAHRVRLLPPGWQAFEVGRGVALDLQTQLLAALPAGRREAFLADFETVANACAAPLAIGKEAATPESSARPRPPTRPRSRVGASGK